MEEVFEFTKSQLVKAFLIYNRQVIEEPELFDIIEGDQETAERQTEKLLSILEQMKPKAV